MATSTRKDRRTTLTFAFLIGVVVVILALVAILLATNDDEVTLDDGTTLDETPITDAADVEVSGDPLPPFAPEAQDAAIGMPMPSFAGTDLAGDPVELAAEGGPTAVVYLAHWCPHCQNEVPEIQQLIDDGAVPDDVEIVAVATGNDSSEPNYPPNVWLHEEGWTPTTLVDDEQQTTAEASGLAAFPYWVFTDAEGAVAHRHAGAMPTEALQEVLESL